MLTRLRLTPPANLSAEGQRIWNTLSAYFLALEQKNALTIDSATGINNTPIGASSPSTGSFTTLKSTTFGAFAPGSLVVNGEFAVAQRQDAAISSALTTAVAYPSLDRWWAYQPTAAAGVFKRSTTAPTGYKYAAQLGRNNLNAGTNKLECGQACETIDCVAYQGQTVTLEFHAKEGANFSAASHLLVSTIDTGTGTDQSSASQAAATWTGQVATTQNNTISTTDAKYTQTLAIPSNATQIGIRFSYTPSGTAGADDNVYIAGVRLYLGSNSPPPRPYGVEFALCQRWLPAWVSDSATFYLCNGYTDVANIAVNLPFEVQTRAKVTGVTVSNVAHITAIEPAGAFVSTAVALGGTKGLQGVNVNATTAGATAGSGATVYLNAIGAYLFLTGAEL